MKYSSGETSKCAETLMMGYGRRAVRGLARSPPQPRSLYLQLSGAVWIVVGSHFSLQRFESIEGAAGDQYRKRLPGTVPP